MCEQLRGCMEGIVNRFWARGCLGYFAILCSAASLCMGFNQRSQYNQEAIEVFMEAISCNQSSVMSQRTDGNMAYHKGYILNYICIYNIKVLEIFLTEIFIYSPQKSSTAPPRQSLVRGLKATTRAS